MKASSKSGSYRRLEQRPTVESKSGGRLYTVDTLQGWKNLLKEDFLRSRPLED